MKLIMKEYQADKEECAFIGDGQNDVPLAREVGLSIAFNAQPERKVVCAYVIEQDRGSEDVRAVAELIDQHVARN